MCHLFDQYSAAETAFKSWFIYSCVIPHQKIIKKNPMFIYIFVSCHGQRAPGDWLIATGLLNTVQGQQNMTVIHFDSVNQPNKK